ncbi:MAG: LptF/LptG family permease [Verrucomicrobiales bacterium]
MIETLTRNPVTTFFQWLYRVLKGWLAKAMGRSDKRSIALKGFMASLVAGLALVFYGTVLDYRAAADAAQKLGAEEGMHELPSLVPLIWQGLGVFLAVLAFVVSLWVREDTSEQGRRGTLIIVALWIAAFASLAAWLPTDVVETQRAISGKGLAGETPSIAAYVGKLFLISSLLLSIPVAAMVYFRLSLMDRYVIHSFLSPFSFCLFSFIAIWLIADFTDNGDSFAGLPLGRLLNFYVVQVPFVILFVMPIVVLLSGLFALGNMSKSNELISMIGTGRSVFRILLPLFIIGAYSSLVCLAFKYQWAPASVGKKEAIMDTAHQESRAKRHGTLVQDDIWSKRGWMHVNEVDRRTWFVGKVPLKLSDEMADVVVFQLDDRDQPEKIWIANRARWVWNAEPTRWVLSGVRIYEYDDANVPRISSISRVAIDDWSETPWKVLSSSQDPEHLGIPGLTMYLNANRDLEDRSLASFRTNWWYVFAEPLACLAMILVAAPLGIVYSRRGGMAGVTGAITVFALMYVMRGTFLAMGHSDRMPPFFAAWTTNFVVAGIGLVLLWFRARNREVPKIGQWPGLLMERVKAVGASG